MSSTRSPLRSEFPACPFCVTNVLVDHLGGENSNKAGDGWYQCRVCSEVFQRERF